MTSLGESDSNMPQEMQSVPWDSLDRYLFGDNAALEGWLAAHPETRPELEAVRIAVQNPMPEVSTTTGDELWSAMSARMDEASKLAAANVAARRKAAEWRKRAFEITGIAAVALVTVLAIHPHGRNVSAISGQLPLDAIPDSSVVSSTPVKVTASIPTTLPATTAPVAPAPIGHPAAPAAPPPAATSSNAQPTGSSSTTAGSNASRSSAPHQSSPMLASATPSDIPPEGSAASLDVGRPVSSMADERPGAANTDWP